MLSKLRSYRPSHGTIVGYIALFVALGGTSYAVSTGSIDSREIKNGTVRSGDVKDNNLLGKDIRNSTIQSRDVGNESLLAEDFAPGQLPTGPQGPSGPGGATGATGPRGLIGQTGPPGPTAGALSASGSTTPPATPGSQEAPPLTVTTTTSGRLFVEGYSGPNGRVTCTGAGACDRSFGLYVNDQPVPNSGNKLAAGSSSTTIDSVSTAGITGVLPPGTYTVKFATTSSANVFSFVGGTRGHVSAIFLGG